MNDGELHVTADWREEPDWELFAQALLALARELESDGDEADDTSLSEQQP